MTDFEEKSEYIKFFNLSKGERGYGRAVRCRTPYPVVLFELFEESNLIQCLRASNAFALSLKYS